MLRSARASSCTARLARVCCCPAIIEPPYSSGTPIPITPRSARPLMMSSGIPSSLASISAASRRLGFWCAVAVGPNELVSGSEIEILHSKHLTPGGHHYLHIDRAPWKGDDLEIASVVHHLANLTLELSAIAFREPFTVVPKDDIPMFQAVNQTTLRVGSEIRRLALLIKTGR